MTIQEACQLVLEAGAMGKGGEIYILTWENQLKLLI
jgi:FlaA1/EpsC-like NDP-sugar epimerase